MLSPTNYHLPSHTAEALANYHLGLQPDLLVGLRDGEASATERVVAEITDPGRNIHFEVQEIGGHVLFLVDDHDREPHKLALKR